VLEFEVLSVHLLGGTEGNHEQFAWLTDLWDDV
jgi:hypothetical protein